MSHASGLWFAAPVPPKSGKVPASQGRARAAAPPHYPSTRIAPDEKRQGGPETPSNQDYAPPSKFLISNFELSPYDARNADFLE
jgi:hypothetical protein